MPSITTRATFLAAATLSTALAGCSSLGHAVFKQPTVSLARVRVTGITGNTGSLDLGLRVVNPNPYSLNGTNLRYEVTVDSATPLAHGALSHEFSVPSHDTTVIGVPITFSFAGLGASGRAIRSFGLVTYHVSGDVTVITPIGNFTVPFKTDGRFGTASLLRQ